jgi:hypothetical protein
MGYLLISGGVQLIVHCDKAEIMHAFDDCNRHEYDFDMRLAHVSVHGSSIIAHVWRLPPTCPDFAACGPRNPVVTNQVAGFSECLPMSGFRFGARAHIPASLMLAASAALVAAIMLLGAMLGHEARMPL